MKATQGSSNHLAAAQIATISLIMNWTGGTGRPGWLSPPGRMPGYINIHLIVRRHETERISARPCINIETDINFFLIDVVGWTPNIRLWMACGFYLIGKMCDRKIENGDYKVCLFLVCPSIAAVIVWLGLQKNIFIGTALH